MEDEWLIVLDRYELGEIRLRLAHVDVGIAVIAEDAELAVEVEIDRRWLEARRIVRVDPDPAAL